MVKVSDVSALFQVPSISETLYNTFLGFSFDLQLIKNNNINNAIKDTILALDLT